MDYTELIYSWITPAANDWYKRQCRNVYQAFYLYYKSSTETEHGALVIDTEPLNDDWLLASPVRVGPGMSINQVKSFDYEVCQQLPILKAS